MNINHYLDNIDIIYWINLDRSIDRKNKMENILKQINIQNTRITAVDGSKISDSELYNNYNNKSYEFGRSKIEYACLLSHLNTIKEFSNSNYELALILEDDISLEYVKYWDKKISEITNEAPKDWEIIMLNYVAKKKLNDIYTLNNNGIISCCGSYLINKAGAKKLMNNLYIDNKFILLANAIHTSDNYIYSNLITYTYKYPYFTYPYENDSTIHNSHIAFHNYTKKLAFESWINKYKSQNVNIINDNKDNNKHTKNIIDIFFDIIYNEKTKKIIILCLFIILLYYISKKYNLLNKK